MKTLLVAIPLFWGITVHASYHMQIHVAGKEAKPLLNALAMVTHDPFPLEEELVCFYRGKRAFLASTPTTPPQPKFHLERESYKCLYKSGGGLLYFRKSAAIWKTLSSLRIVPIMSEINKEKEPPLVRNGITYKLNSNYTFGSIRLGLKCEEFGCKIDVLSYDIEENPWKDEHGKKPTGGHY